MHTYIQCEFQQLHGMKTIEAERMRLQNKPLHVAFHSWTRLDNQSCPEVFCFFFTSKVNGLVSGDSFILTRRMILYNMLLMLAIKPPYLYKPNKHTIKSLFGCSVLESPEHSLVSHTKFISTSSILCYAEEVITVS